MANSKRRKKAIRFALIGLVLAGLAVVALTRKREAVITIQTEKVARQSLTEVVVANGKIQPVVQVTISPEVSGEIIELPVKEGQMVQKGDLIVKIKPDYYAASRNQAEASYESSLAGKATAEANLRKAQAEFRRSEELFQSKLISDSAFDEAKAAFDVAVAQVNSAEHQVEMSKASLASAEEQLSKTTIVSPLTGTISRLNSEVGERVLGTVQNIGTEIMTIADLNAMEARVDIGEMDVILIKPGQNARLEVDAFKDRKFTGLVTEIANSAKGSGTGAGASLSSSSQEATKFEVHIRIKEKEAFRPGMSVTAEIETRSRTNALCVPIATVTTRMPKKPETKGTPPADPPGNSRATGENHGAKSNIVEGVPAAGTPGLSTNSAVAVRKAKENNKAIEVVFVLDGDHAKMVPVKIGIADDAYWEIIEGIQEGQEVVSGSYRAINRELEDGKIVRKGLALGPEKEIK